MHRSGVPSAETVRGFLRRAHDPAGEGADSILSTYRIVNTNSLGAPLISTGPEKGERQGSTNAIWSYSIRVSELVEVTRDIVRDTFEFGTWPSTAAGSASSPG